MLLSELVSQWGRSKLVHRRNDRWGDILVIDQGDHRILTFDSIYEQSRFNLKHPALLVHYYTRAMLLGLAFMEPRHITLLGLGSGCLLQAFHRMFDNAVFEVVEYRQAVVDVASEFFNLPASPNIRVSVTDAGHYLKATPAASTDMIFADMYTAEDMNPLQLQKSFLRQCHRVLTEEGWLVGNFHELPDPTSEFFTVLHSLFAEVLLYHVPDENYIIYASKHKLIASLETYALRTKWFPYNDKIGYDFLFSRIVRLSKQ